MNALPSRSFSFSNRDGQLLVKLLKKKSNANDEASKGNKKEVTWGDQSSLLGS
jgi:hypothetical protein